MDNDGRLLMADAMAIGAVIDKGVFEGRYSSTSIIVSCTGKWRISDENRS